MGNIAINEGALLVTMELEPCSRHIQACTWMQTRSPLTFQQLHLYKVKTHPEKLERMKLQEKLQIKKHQNQHLESNR